VQRLGELHQLHSQLGPKLGEARLKKPRGENKNLEIIRDCYAIYRRIEKELTLTHVAASVGTEATNSPTAWPCLACSVKKKNCVCNFAKKPDSEVTNPGGGTVLFT